MLCVTIYVVFHTFNGFSVNVNKGKQIKQIYFVLCAVGACESSFYVFKKSIYNCETDNLRSFHPLWDIL